MLLHDALLGLSALSRLAAVPGGFVISAAVIQIVIVIGHAEVQLHLGRVLCLTGASAFGAVDPFDAGLAFVVQAQGQRADLAAEVRGQRCLASCRPRSSRRIARRPCDAGPRRPGCRWCALRVLLVSVVYHVSSTPPTSQRLATLILAFWPPSNLNRALICGPIARGAARLAHQRSVDAACFNFSGKVLCHGTYSAPFSAVYARTNTHLKPAMVLGELADRSVERLAFDRHRNARAQRVRFLPSSRTLHGHENTYLVHVGLLCLPAASCLLADLCRDLVQLADALGSADHCVQLLRRLERSGVCVRQRHDLFPPPVQRALVKALSPAAVEQRPQLIGRLDALR